MSISEAQAAQVSRDAAAIITAGLSDWLDGRQVGDAPSDGMPGVDQLIEEAGALLPVVASALTGYCCALIIRVAQQMGQEPLDLWQGFCRSAEQRRSM